MAGAPYLSTFGILLPIVISCYLLALVKVANMVTYCVLCFGEECEVYRPCLRFGVTES